MNKRIGGRSSNPQAGWYQDPGRPPGHLRYWDGARWTEHEAVPPRGVSTGAAAGRPTSWIRKRALVSALIALVVLGWSIDMATGQDQDTQGGAVGDTTADRPADEPVTEPVDDGSRGSGAVRNSGAQVGDSAAARARTREKRVAPEPIPQPSRKPTPARQPHTYLVTRVIDGDTIELGNGSDVRIVGIDTPEVGQCGYDAATSNLARLVLNRQVRLSMSDEDTDHYGRWLRYVNVGTVDAGLRQIQQGFAIARYDSRDGYGFHVREPRYIAADRASPGLRCPRPVALSGGGGGGACAPGYNPCVPPFPPDADCADVDGPITVTGADPHGLDADGDGVACE